MFAERVGRARGHCLSGCRGGRRATGDPSLRIIGVGVGTPGPGVVVEGRKLHIWLATVSTGFGRTCIDQDVGVGRHHY